MGLMCSSAWAVSCHSPVPSPQEVSLSILPWDSPVFTQCHRNWGRFLWLSNFKAVLKYLFHATWKKTSLEKSEASTCHWLISIEFALYWRQYKLGQDFFIFKQWGTGSPKLWNSTDLPWFEVMKKKNHTTQCLCAIKKDRHETWGRKPRDSKGSAFSDAHLWTQS